MGGAHSRSRRVCRVSGGERAVVRARAAERLQGARLAGLAPLPDTAPAVQRRVSSRGGIQVARQRIQVGMTHAGKIVTVIGKGNKERQLPIHDRAADARYR